MRRVLRAWLTAITLIAVIAIGGAATLPAEGTSRWVRFGDDHRLHYATAAIQVAIDEVSRLARAYEIRDRRATPLNPPPEPEQLSLTV